MVYGRLHDTGNGHFIFFHSSLISILNYRKSLNQTEGELKESPPSSRDSTPSPDFPVFQCGSSRSNSNLLSASPPRSPIAPPYSPITPDPQNSVSSRSTQYYFCHKDRSIRWILLLTVFRVFLSSFRQREEIVASSNVLKVGGLEACSNFWNLRHLRLFLDHIYKQNL